MQKEIKLGIVVGFALLLAILLVWYKSGESPEKQGTDVIGNLISEEKQAPGQETKPSPPEPPLPAQVTPPVEKAEKPPTEVTPAPGQETVVIPQTVPVKGEMGPAPPKRIEVAEGPKQVTPKPPVEHHVVAPPKLKSEPPKGETPRENITKVEPKKPVEVALAAEQTYTVQQGDSLSSIAGEFYKDKRKWRVILEANKTVIHDPDRLLVGAKLKIPPLSEEKAKPAEVKPVAAKEKPALKEGAAPVEKEKPVAKETGPRKYTVKEGDTLTRIAAEEYGDEDMVDKIIEANKIKDKNKLYVGQVLVIPPK